MTQKPGVYDITDSGAEQRLTERRENGNDTVLGAGSPRLHKHEIHLAPIIKIQ